MWDLFKSEITFNWKTIKSLQKEHKIVDEDWETIVWKWIFWDKIKEWQDAKEVYLNSPTWIATDLEKLYISDTLNDRILYLSWSNIYTLLDETDWLNEPTWLYFDDSEKALYIANSWSGEVLKFSSLKLSEIPVFNFSWVTSSVSEISITLLLNWKKKELTNTGIELENFWLDTIPSPPPNQSFETATAEATLSWWSIIYKFKTETYSWWTLDNTIFPNPKDRNMDFYANQTYTIKFNEQNEFWEAWNYAVNIKFWDELNEEKFYFFTQWDEKIYTKNDNILEVVNYPNWIISNTNFEQFNVSWVENLSFDEENDIILKVPIESLEISENWEDLINIILKYYRNYNCYNLDENKEKIETFISKINLNK
jgi:hypothetical protein